jgi:hypothetical protein
MPVAKSPLPTTTRKPMESTAVAPDPGSNRHDRRPVLLAATTNMWRCGDSGGRCLLNEAPMGHGVGAPGRPHPRHAKLSDLSLFHAPVALGSFARSSSASSTSTSLHPPSTAPPLASSPPVHLLGLATASSHAAVEDGDCDAATRPRPTSSGSGSHDSPEAKHGPETQSQLTQGHPRAGDTVTTRLRPTSDGRRSHDSFEAILEQDRQSRLTRG